MAWKSWPQASRICYVFNIFTVEYKEKRKCSEQSAVDLPQIFFDINVTLKYHVIPYFSDG